MTTYTAKTIMRGEIARTVEVCLDANNEGDLYTVEMHRTGVPSLITGWVATFQTDLSGEVTYEIPDNFDHEMGAIWAVLNFLTTV